MAGMTAWLIARGSAPVALLALLLGVTPAQGDDLPAAILGNAPPLQGESIAYFSEDPAVRGYLALPSGEGPFGTVILIHEWNGLVDRIREVADALAAEGYVALAEIIANLDAAARFLRARPDVSGKIATVGWCYGGGVALSYAIGGENHDATAIFYGRLVDDPAKLAAIDHEIYGTFARLDGGPSPEQVDRFVAALRAAKIPNDVHIYDDVNHGFWLHVDQDPDVRARPAKDAWRRLKAYFERSIGDSTAR
jgi:carboxymethylenebutenolidase